jgi:predicted esterase
MNERHITVGRTARYCTTGSDDAPELWIACHGYAQLARYFIRPFAQIAGADRVVVAPEALSRYYFETAPGVHAADARIGATWMTREDREHEIADYVAYLDALAAHVNAGDRRVVALGFSQGAATVSRWAARGNARIDHIVLWGTGPAAEIEPAPDMFRGATVTLAAGRSDEFFDVATAERVRSRLSAAGVECDVHAYDGGHRIDAAPLESLVARLSPRG